MTEAELALDRDLAILRRLAEIGMELAEALGAHAKVRITDSANKACAIQVGGENPTDAFNKMAQTVRRTLALKARLAEGMKASRARPGAEQAPKPLQRPAAKGPDGIVKRFREALDSGEGEVDRERAENLLADLDEMLFDTFIGHGQGPISEAIAELCEILQIEPGLCLPDGDGWKIRNPAPDFGLGSAPAAANLWKAPTVRPVAPPGG